MCLVAALCNASYIMLDKRNKMFTIACGEVLEPCATVDWWKKGDRK